jgi:hypothetical protein
MGHSDERVYQTTPLQEIAASLASIAASQWNLTAATMDMAGIAKAYVEDEEIKLRPFTEEELQGAPRRQPGHTSTRLGTGGAAAWVFMPGPPCNDMEIVCVPDSAATMGIRCEAIQKLVGGERAKYDVSFTRKETQ